MKQIQLKKFKGSRRSKEGNVDVRAETEDGELVQINFTPEVSEQILWSILSTSGQTYANDWKLWPLTPDHLVRGTHPDGVIDLTFVQQQRAAFQVRISPDLRQALIQALTQGSQASTAPTEDLH
ncbi:MAG: hypothetical protein ACN6OK_05645 [Alcaligenes faecalis]